MKTKDLIARSVRLSNLFVFFTLRQFKLCIGIPISLKIDSIEKLKSEEAIWFANGAACLT